MPGAVGVSVPGAVSVPGWVCPCRPRLYLRCLKPCEPSGPSGCRITLLGCLVSSGCEIRGGLSRMGLSCSSSGLALPRMRFLASAYSASRWASDFTGKAGRAAECALLRTPLVVGLLRMRIWGGGPAGRLSSWITMGTLGGDLDFLLLGTETNTGLVLVFHRGSLPGV